jgi:uncharacterized membrane protein
MNTTHGVDLHHRSLAKAVSWRITGSIDTFVVSWIVTGRLTLAAPIALTELLTKIGLYYLHERAWSLVRWGKK